MPQLNVTMEQGKGYEIESVVGPSTEETITLKCVIESIGGVLLVKETSDNGGSDDEIEISPFVKSLQTGVNIPADLDYKKEYHKYLTEKYK